jgi:hypothetical protein
MAYAAVADIRGLAGMSNPPFTDTAVQSGIDFATKRIDDYCGTSFEAKAFTVTLDGNLDYKLWTNVLFIQTLTSVTIDGVVVANSNFSFRPEGILTRIDGAWFPWSAYGRNVVVVGTAGVTTTPPEDIKWAARTLARQWMLDLHNRLPDRSIQMANEYGQFVLAQSGGPGRPTSLPDVNTVLNANKHRSGMAGFTVA